MLANKQGIAQLIEWFFRRFISIKRCISVPVFILANRTYLGAMKPLSELRVRLAPLNRFKPSSKIFYWPFQGGTPFVDLLCFCSVLCLLCLCARLFICALWSPAGKGLTSWLSFVVSAVSLSLSHWYPGSGVVLDCIHSWSLHPYLLLVTVIFSDDLPGWNQYCIMGKNWFCSITQNKKAMIRNRYNQIPHLTQDTIWERGKTLKESQEVSPFTAMNR